MSDHALVRRARQEPPTEPPPVREARQEPGSASGAACPRQWTPGSTSVSARHRRRRTDRPSHTGRAVATISFLGYALDDLSDEAVIDVCPRVTERAPGGSLQRAIRWWRGSIIEPHHPESRGWRAGGGTRVGAAAGDLRPGHGEGQRAGDGACCRRDGRAQGGDVRGTARVDRCRLHGRSAATPGGRCRAAHRGLAALAKSQTARHDLTVARRTPRHELACSPSRRFRPSPASAWHHPAGSSGLG